MSRFLGLKSVEAPVGIMGGGWPGGGGGGEELWYGWTLELEGGKTRAH